MTVRPAGPADRAGLVRLRQELWPDSTAEEVDQLLDRPVTAGLMLVAEEDGGGLAGFAELGIRNYAEGCLTSPVGYLEGIWVDPDARRSGIARGLVAAGLAWARSQGYREFASDTEWGNEASLAFHRAAGFELAGRIVCFRQPVR